MGSKINSIWDKRSDDFVIVILMTELLAATLKLYQRQKYQEQIMPFKEFYIISKYFIFILDAKASKSMII